MMMLVYYYYEVLTLVKGPTVSRTMVYKHLYRLGKYLTKDI